MSKSLPCLATSISIFVKGPLQQQLPLSEQALLKEFIVFYRPGVAGAVL